MRVVYIHQYFETPSQFGGLRSYQNARHLVKEGHQVTVITGSLNYHKSSDAKRHDGNWYHAETIDGIDVIWVDSIFSYHRSFTRRLLSFLTFMILAAWAGLRVPCDVVYATSPPLTVIVPAFVISLARRAKLIFEVRDLWPESAVTTGVLRNPLLIKLAELLESFAYRVSDAIVSVSEGIDEVLRHRGIKPGKLHIVRHGADLEFLNIANPQSGFRQEYDLHDKFIAIYAGSFGWANGLETVIEASRLLEAYDNIRIVLLGDGKEKAALVKLVQGYSLRNIVFATPVAKDKIGFVLGAADVGLMVLRNSPTFATVLPNKLLDYLGSGLPVIINFSGYASRIVDEANAGVLVAPDSPQALSEAIIRMSNDPGGCRSMGNSGRKHIVENYSRDAAVRSFESVLQKTIKA